MYALALLLSPEYAPYHIALAAVLGAMVGSFLTLATYRLPRDEPIGMTRSQCPQCLRKLRLPDLIPMLSWLIARGRCRYCKTPVSFRYPLTELACAIGAACIVGYYGMSLEALALGFFWWCFVAIVITDLEHTIILDEVQIALALAGMLYAYVQDADSADVIVAAAVGVSIGLALKYGFLYFCNKDGLGLGDVKFLGVAGIWLADAKNFVPFLFFSGVLGILSGLAWRACGHGERFPFGPALALALWLCILFPHTANGFWKLYGLLH